MHVIDQLRNTDADVRLVLPGLNAPIALAASSWYTVALSVGLTGPRANLSVRARRMAGPLRHELP